MSTRRTAIVDQAEGRHKQLSALSEKEIFLLMQAYTRDKTCITEADALTLCHWAQGIKFGSYVLALVLEQRLRITVEGAEVKIGLPL